MHGKHAIGRASRLDVRKPENSTLRQCSLRGGFEDANAVSGPHLNDEFEVLFAGAKAAESAHRCAGRQPGTQRKRHLLHVVIEDVVGFLKHRPVGHEGLDACGHHDGGQEKPQETRTK